MSARCPDLPFLPGFTFNPLIGRTKFNRDPKFDFIAEGVPGLVERVKPNMLGALSDRYPSLYPRGEVPELPTWIAFDKQILRFNAFFKETLQEFRAPFQVRKVNIYLFLEDGTMQVIEPKVDNSGIPQGTLISRQRIRFPPPMDANFYDIMDLNVGNEVEFFGRVFKITDCDRFTRGFLNRCGIAVPDPINTPPDPYLDNRSHDGEALLPKKPSRKTDTLGQFLANDRKVLRFYGYWDDQETAYGYLHHLELHYYLADDTIDIKENVVDNAGHDSSFIFMRRAKLPKLFKGLPGVGADSPFTVLNVLGPGLQGGRYIADSLDCGREHIDFYREQDLTIGGVVNVFGRKVVITDCDPYTKEYYRIKYGIDDFTPVPAPEDVQKAPCHEVKERELPPWNGYGTFEDSAQNCITVEPKAPCRDFKKFLKFDKVGLDSHVLRFEARLLSKIPQNCDRIFIISYYLSDETISVFELAKRNSDFPHSPRTQQVYITVYQKPLRCGKAKVLKEGVTKDFVLQGFKTSPFFKRGEIKLPGQATFTSQPPECYKPQHMFVGATIDINGFEYVLLDADDYALRYMELNAHEYPKANIKLIMDKVREVLRPIYKDFVAENMPTETPVITYGKLRDKLCRVMGDNFTEHEMITIARAFSANCVEERFSREAIRAITLTELKRFLWDDLERLTEYFVKRDHQRCGKLPRHKVYTLLRACRLPLDVVLIERILNVIKKDENSNIFYQDLLNFLDRTKCPLTDVVPINIKYDLWWGSERDPKAGTLIDWCEFNKFLDLEKTFNETPGRSTTAALEMQKH